MNYTTRIKRRMTILFLLFLILTPNIQPDLLKPVNAQWEDYGYRKEITVTGSTAGAVTDYPLRFTVYSDLNVTDLSSEMSLLSTDVIPNTLPQESDHQGMGFVVEVGSTWYMIYGGKNATQRWTPILCNSTNDRLSWTKEGIQLDLLSPLMESSYITTSILEGSTYYIYGQIMDNDADMDTGSDYAIGYWTTTDFRSFSWGGVAANGTALGYAKPLTNPSVNKVGSTFYMAVAERIGAGAYKIRMLSCPNATGPFTNVGVILDAGAASWGTSGFWDPEIFVWNGLYVLHVGGSVGGTHENYGFAYSHDITKNFTATDEYYTHSGIIGGRASVVVGDDASTVSIYADAVTAGESQIMNFTLNDLIDLNGNSQADCDDIEFKTSSGTTVPHFKSEITADTSYYVWVGFPSLAQSTVYTYYIYYGDATASDSSSGLDVFTTLFDHFDDDSLNATLWQTTGTTSESGTSIIATGQANPSAIHTQSAMDFEGKKLIIKARTPDTQDRAQPGGLTYTADYSDAVKGWRIFWTNDAQSATHVQKQEQFGGGNLVNTITQDGIYHHYEIYRKTIGTEWIVDAVSYDTSSNDPNVNEYITATRTFGASAAGNKAETDWVGVGFYIDPEPTVLISSQESAPPPSGNNAPTVTSFLILDLTGGDILYKTIWYRPQMIVDDADGFAEIDWAMWAFWTDKGWHNVSYNAQADVWDKEAGGSRFRIQDGYFESSGTEFSVYFYFKAEESMDPHKDVDVYTFVNDTSGAGPGWALTENNYFEILDWVDEPSGGGDSTPPSGDYPEEPQDDWIDTDGDGIPDWDDDDMDGDDIPNDYDEDIDGDGIPNNEDPNPHVPEIVFPESEYLISFTAPNGRLINLIPKVLFTLEFHQKLVVPYILLLLLALLFVIYRSRRNPRKKRENAFYEKMDGLSGSVKR